MFHCHIYTKEYLEGDSSWSVTPSSALLQKIHAIPDQTTTRWIAMFRAQGQEYKIALGSPVEGSENALYFPAWFLDSAGIPSDGDERIIRFEASERMQKATQLTFKTIGIIPDWVDIVSILEEPLSQLGVLKKGQMIPIPVIEDALLVLEESNGGDQFVFMDGSDIALDVIPDETIQHEQEPDQEQTQDHLQDESITQEADEAQAHLQSLIETPPLRGKFTAFQGKGYVLGGRS
jgi:hypothetical protein